MYTLLNALQLHNKYPDTFEIPGLSEIKSLEVGDFAKLGFEEEGKATERMWVIIESIAGESFVGTLNNDPFSLESIGIDDVVNFEAKHILSTMKR